MPQSKSEAFCVPMTTAKRGGWQKAVMASLISRVRPSRLSIPMFIQFQFIPLHPS
jgi:hypothetical protein